MTGFRGNSGAQFRRGQALSDVQRRSRATSVPFTSDTYRWQGGWPILSRPYSFWLHLTQIQFALALKGFPITQQRHDSPLAHHIVRTAAANPGGSGPLWRDASRLQPDASVGQRSPLRWKKRKF
jgi:phage major head subunit gpT-like protein